MCGIAGKVTAENKKVSSNEMETLLSAIAHRGPDDKGVELLGKIALGQQRLAIIDLSPKGHQPMPYEDKRYWITFNGEIYNFQELRDRLLKKGYRFRSSSDTEVMLAAYEAYGKNCVKEFNGMFAFALYDKLTDTLFAARDRLGEKPFKYFFDGKTFIFASEVKAILTQPEVHALPDTTAIKQYLYWGFVPAPRTGFLHIFKLPAAHYLVLKKGKLTIERYWEFSGTVDNDRSEEETIQTLRELVTDSVRLRMIADVPIGSFLSGGIDSCVVTGIMSKLSKDPIRTFTIGFDGWKDNEAALAKLSSEFHHTKHTVLTVKPDLSKVIPAIVKAYDEPFGDVSAIPSYYVSQITRKKVTVALNGDGGDENFAGYSNYLTYLTQKRFTSYRPLFGALHALLTPLRPLLETNALYQRALRISDLLKETPLDGYARHSRGYLNLIPWNDLFNTKPSSPIKEFRRYLPARSTDELNTLMYADLHNVLPDGLMTKMDIASMQHALETRAPLLDHRLIEFCASIPSSMKYRNGTTKWIFKEAFKDYIPKEVLESPKRGFVMPVNEWLRTTLKPLMEDTLLKPDAPIYTIVKYSLVEKMVQMHRDGTVDYSVFLWRLIMLEKWWETYCTKSV